MNHITTLAQVLAPGRLPDAEALRYALQLGECLLKVHDGDRWHGALSPSNIAITSVGLELLPVPEGSARMVTPYSSPEVVQGQPADRHSDIFSFAAIVFELLTGRRAFDGDSRASLVAQINEGPTPQSGTPALDQLVGPCLSKSPDARPASMQKVLQDLKVLNTAAKPAAQHAFPSLRREPVREPALGRTEMQELESRLAARLLLHERAMADLHRSASEAVSNVKLQVASLSSDLAINRPSPGSSGPAEQGTNPARSDRGLDALASRIAQIERTVEEMRRKFSQFEHNIAADLVDIEEGMKTQGAAIESARTAMAQTDDLVERVVEALESLQTTVLNEDEPAPERAAFAVN